MSPDTELVQHALDRLHREDPLSGVVTIHVAGQRAIGRADGYANRADSLPNALKTRFQIASGCKIFTSVAICQLVARGAFAFDTPLRECLDIDFPHFDPRVTVHHLLTHTSGIPDYFDEQGGQDYEEVWRHRPMYAMRGPRDFLTLFQGGAMQFEPGAKFSYNDAAFIVLGLIVEQHAKEAFPAYVKSSVFTPCGMTDSGYFRLDCLPERTASAYIQDEPDGPWRSNIYSVPIVGGPDGGAFVTAPDMARFWQCLHTHRLLPRLTTETMLAAHAAARGHRTPTHYGYGVWITEDPVGTPVYYVEGWDPGVAFLSASYPARELVLTIACNLNRSAWRVFDAIAPIVEAILPR